MATRTSATPKLQKVSVAGPGEYTLAGADRGEACVWSIQWLEPPDVRDVGVTQTWEHVICLIKAGRY